MTNDPGRLHEDIRALANSLNRDIRERWARSLPFEELLFDRWERASTLGFGPGSSVYQSSIILGDVAVGPATWIGPFTILDGSGAPLRIGGSCSISTGVQIYTHDSVKRALSGGSAALEKGPVTIGDNCYIGPNAVIARGVTVGDRSVVGTNSFVNRDVPPNSIAVGNPARVIGAVQLRPDGDVELVYEGARP